MNKSLSDLKLNLLNAARIQLDHRWDYNNIISPFSRIYLVTDGEARVFHHNHSFGLKPGYLYLIPSFTYSRYQCRSYMEQCYVHFTEEAGHGLSVYNLLSFAYERPASILEVQLFERLLEINPGRHIEKNDPKTYDNRASTQRMLQLNDFTPITAQLETQGILKILLSGFLKTQGENEKKAYPERIANVLYYISEHLSEDLTIEQLAAYCHLNPDYFSRIFKTRVMMRPLEYIQHKRIERAQLLLSTTSYSVKEVAELSGLPNISYFNRLFVRITGQTPSSYRKTYWNI